MHSERLSQNVVAPNFQVGRVDSLKKTRLKIGRDDAAEVGLAADGRGARGWRLTRRLRHGYENDGADDGRANGDVIVERRYRSRVLLSLCLRFN